MWKLGQGRQTLHKHIVIVEGRTHTHTHQTHTKQRVPPKPTRHTFATFVTLLSVHLCDANLICVWSMCCMFCAYVLPSVSSMCNVFPSIHTNHTSTTPLCLVCTWLCCLCIVRIWWVISLCTWDVSFFCSLACLWSCFCSTGRWGRKSKDIAVWCAWSWPHRSWWEWHHYHFSIVFFLLIFDGYIGFKFKLKSLSEDDY